MSPAGVCTSVSGGGAGVWVSVHDVLCTARKRSRAARRVRRRSRSGNRGADSGDGCTLNGAFKREFQARCNEEQGEDLLTRC